MTGPLAGVRVVEIASIGPGPFAAMVMSDLGAEVIRVDRPDAGGGAPTDPLLRGRSASITLDLKNPLAIEALLRLVERSDVLVEGFRPGVAERLGFGPDVCAARNPRLVFGRVTGWGQTGPRANDVGHDIDYIAVSGALHPIGAPGGTPIPPLNLVADFGGGGMLLVVGVLAALVERERSGTGQVVDAAMVDGSALLMAMHFGFLADGLWSEARGDNLLDGGAPFYRCYQTSDERFVAVGALESRFYAALIKGLDLGSADLPAQYDRSGWEELTRRFGEVFRSRTRDEWAAIFSGTEACVVPVLTAAEAPADSHMSARRTYVEVNGVVQPGIAPRFSVSQATDPRPGRPPGVDTAAVLLDLGFTESEIRSIG